MRPLCCFPDSSTPPQPTVSGFCLAHRLTSAARVQALIGRGWTPLDCVGGDATIRFQLVVGRRWKSTLRGRSRGWRWKPVHSSHTARWSNKNVTWGVGASWLSTAGASWRPPTQTWRTNERSGRALRHRASFSTADGLCAVGSVQRSPAHTNSLVRNATRVLRTRDRLGV